MQMNRTSGFLPAIQCVLGVAWLSLDLSAGEPGIAGPTLDPLPSLTHTSARLGAVTRVIRENKVRILPGGAAVTFDSVTQRVRAAWPGELAALVGALGGPGSGTEGVTIVHYESGAKSAFLPVTYLETATAVRRPDGSLVIECSRELERQAGSRQPTPASPAPKTAELR